MIDVASDRMILVEAEKRDVQALLAAMPDWIVIGESSVRLPDDRPKVRRAPARPKAKRIVG